MSGLQALEVVCNIIKAKSRCVRQGRSPSKDSRKLTGFCCSYIMPKKKNVKTPLLRVQKKFATKQLTSCFSSCFSLKTWPCSFNFLLYCSVVYMWKTYYLIHKTHSEFLMCILLPCSLNNLVRINWTGGFLFVFFSPLLH